MVKFIESELVLLKKEIDEMWTLVYNQLGRQHLWSGTKRRRTYRCHSAGTSCYIR